VKLPKLLQVWDDETELWLGWFTFLRTRKKLVDKTPIITTLLLEAANVQQLKRMWTEHTAAGQSITAWVSVNIALWLWVNFYLNFNPDNKWAIRGTALGIALNTTVILTVAYFRYVAR
jgi:hypothetical protein